MIHAVLVFNNYGKPRLSKFYAHCSARRQQEILSETFELVSRKSDDDCNFVERSDLFGADCKLMFRHFTTLYFVFCCDASESELAILDLIQVFVEALDKCFRNVCELDLIFHPDRALFLLDEVVMAGVVLDTDLYEITTRSEHFTALAYNDRFTCCFICGYILFTNRPNPPPPLLTTTITVAAPIKLYFKGAPIIEFGNGNYGY